MITNDLPPITINSNEVADTIKKNYLNDLAKIIASDSNLIRLVTEKLKSNLIKEWEILNSKIITDDIEEPIVVETETAELEDEILREDLDRLKTLSHSDLKLQDNNLVSNQEANLKKADTTSEKSADDKTTQKNDADIHTKTTDIKVSVPENTITPKTENKAITKDAHGVKQDHPEFSEVVPTEEKKAKDNSEFPNQVAKKKIKTNDRAETRQTQDKSHDTSKEKTFDDTIATIKTLDLEGKTNGEIVKVLNNHEYPTLKGSRGKWRSNQVESILKRHQ